MAKKLKVGSLLVNKRKFMNQGKEVEKTMISIGLGNIKNLDPKYNLTVEFIVKDHNGNIVHRQENGFINLVDPRTQPDELLSAGLISQEIHASMKERISKLPEMVKYSLEIPLKF